MKFPNPFAGLGPVIGWLAFMRLVGGLGFAISLPFLSIYLHEDLGIAMSVIGVMLATAGLLGGVSATAGGMLSDRIGRRSLLIGLLALRAVSFLLLAYLVWAKSPFAIFAAVYIFSSILGTSIFPLTEAIVSDVTPTNKRADAFSVLRVASNLGWAIGPAVGGVLVIFGYYWLFVVTAMMIGGAATVASFAIHETNKPVAGVKNKTLLAPVLRDRRLMIFMGVGLLMFLARGQLISTLSVHLSGTVGLSKSQIGWLYALNGGMVAALQMLTTKYTNRINPLSALSFAAGMYAAGYFLVGWAGGMIEMIVAMLIITTAEMIETPTAAAYVTMLAPEGLTGSYLGVFHFAFHLGWTVGPMVGGIFIDLAPDPLYAWTGIATLAAIGGIGFRIMKEFDSRRVAALEAPLESRLPEDAA